MATNETASFGDVIGALGDGIAWVVTQIGLGFWHMLIGLLPFLSPAPAEGEKVTPPIFDWLSWDGSLEDKQSLMAFVYYGGSVEFFFIFLNIVLVVSIYGMFFNNNFLWGSVRVLEGLANKVGRFFAWAGLLMVLQQIIIVFMQRIFTRPDISFGFGIPLQFDISWFAEELKLYNALVVALCVTYTFVQGGHVRVDLIYSAVSHRAKRVIDMVGSLLFMLPGAIMIWMYSWYFLWRHLIVPKVNATDQLDRLVLKARAFRWNVETVGFSPNGFTGYFLFKILLLLFAGLVILQAIAFFWRSYLEWKEGEDSAGKYMDKDTLGEGEEAYEGAH
jgi:TRAP-type mannitol/chloroaromatic compound transport system permease small subunit